jgi:hypothetical protein
MVWANASPDGYYFHWVLALYRLRLSADPRDKIYGLLGLGPQELDGHFSLNYAATVEDVFEKFTVEYIRYSKSLGILGALGGKRQIPKLPSFCPDWTIVPGSDPSDDETMMVQLSNRLVVQPLYLATHGMTSPDWRQIDHGIVAVNGFIFDVIRGVSCENFRQPWEKRRQWVKSIRVLAEHVDTNSFLRTLCGGLTWSQKTRNYGLIQDNPEIYDERLRKWWTWTMSDSDPGIAQSDDVISVEQAVLTISAGRNFIVTEKGYIGYAEQHCHPGNLVSVLGGGHTPFILASKSSQYQVIGDAYIHGIMRGEAFALTGRHSNEFGEIILV